ncbi:MAG: exodeoxyribonuclease III [Lentihominibacter sp.]|jgi:exodeoxyribonuclease-3
MKLISWNVNGIRAVMKKGFLEFVAEADPDVMCVQETKMQEGQAEIPLDGYHQYWCSAERKGYSGTAVFTKKEPLSVTYGIGIDEHDREGRVITCEYEDFYLVNVYTPNSQDGLKRLDYRMTWDDAFREYLKGLEAGTTGDRGQSGPPKPVIVCGDLNVAHKEIDLKNPKNNRKNAGFTDEERAKMTQLLEAGFTDTWRYFYPDLEGVYSWWTYRFNARANNAGWRIDYFVVSEELNDRLKKAEILTEVMGSDHCPVTLTLAAANVI